MSATRLLIRFRHVGRTHNDSTRLGPTDRQSRVRSRALSRADTDGRRPMTETPNVLFFRLRGTSLEEDAARKRRQQEQKRAEAPPPAPPPPTVVGRTTVSDDYNNTRVTVGGSSGASARRRHTTRLSTCVSAIPR